MMSPAERRVGRTAARGCALSRALASARKRGQRDSEVKEPFLRDMELVMAYFFTRIASSIILLVGFTLSTHAFAEAPRQGPTARWGLGVTTGVVGLSYDGPSAGSPEEEGYRSSLELKSQHPFVALEVSAGGGYWLSNHRLGLEMSAFLGPTLGHMGELPYTALEQVAGLTLGPTYTYAVSPRFELDASVRGTVLTFIGSRADIGAYDNVIDTSAHWGALGRIGAIFRPRPKGSFALTSALSGGPQYAGFQRTFLMSWMVGVQWY